MFKVEYVYTRDQVSHYKRVDNGEAASCIRHHKGTKLSSNIYQSKVSLERYHTEWNKREVYGSKPGEWVLVKGSPTSGNFAGYTREYVSVLDEEVERCTYQHVDGAWKRIN